MKLRSIIIIELPLTSCLSSGFVTKVSSSSVLHGREETGLLETEGTGSLGTEGTGLLGIAGTGSLGTEGTGWLGTEGTGLLGTGETGLGALSTWISSFNFGNILV